MLAPIDSRFRREHQRFVAVRKPMLSGLRWRAYREEAENIARREGISLARARAEVARTHLQEPLILEAIHLASAGLTQRLLDMPLDQWIKGEDASPLLAFERYFSRMCFRPTPYGAFATLQIGEVAEDCLSANFADDGTALRRRISVDEGLMRTLSEWASKSFRGSARYLANPFLTTEERRYRYLDWRTKNNGDRQYEMALVDRHPVMDAVLSACSTYRSCDQITQYVQQRFDLATEAIDELVADMTHARLLLSSFGTSALGPETSERFATLCAQSEVSKPLGQQLSVLRDRLERHAASPIVSPADYRALDAAARALLRDDYTGSALRVDMVRTGSSFSLPESIARQVSEAIDRLTAAFGLRDTSLQSFQEYFVRVHGKSRQPLLEILEDERVVDSMERLASSPILSTLGLRSARSTTTSSGSSMRPFDELLLDKLLEQRDDIGTLELTDEDLSRHGRRPSGSVPERSFAILQLLGDAADTTVGSHPRIALLGVSNRPIASWLGRFAFASPEIANWLREDVSAQVAADTDTLHAEIAFEPATAVGNILSRPLFWPHRLLAGGEPGDAAPSDIPLSNVLVSVEEGGVKLWCRKTGRRIVAHMSSAHNAEHVGSTQAYRFLRALEGQGSLFSHFGWGGPFLQRRRLPRVVYRSIVLAPARWTMSAKESKALSSMPLAELRDALRDRGMPSAVELKDGDNTLVLDLADEFDLRQVRREAGKRRGLVFTELLDVDDGGSRRRHEVLLPLRRAAQEAREDEATQQTSPILTSDLTPVSPAEVVYFKYYLASTEADALLVKVIGPLMTALQADGAISRWFFIRYNDPEFHLRVRVFVTSPACAGEVYAAMAGLWRSHGGVIRRIQTDIYERETARYGDGSLMSQTELNFHSDSVRAIDLISQTPSETDRLKGTLQDLLSTLAETGADLVEQLELMASVAGAFRSEHAVTSAQRKRLGVLYKTLFREAIDLPQCGQPSERYLMLRREASSDQWGTLIRGHLHMLCNRRLVDHPRMYEVVLYEAAERRLREAVSRRV